MKINQYRRLCLYLQQQAWSDTGNYTYKERILFEIHRQYHKYIKNPFLDVHARTCSLYIHIPKTGGNSVTQVLYKRRSKEAGSHRAAWEYQVCDQRKFEDYFVFATVRHPLARMRSAFYYLKNGGMNASDRALGEGLLGPYKTFVDFARALAADEGLRLQIKRKLHFLPQSYFLCDIRGQCIVPHLLHQERFDTKLAEICDRLNIPYAPRRDNPTPRHIIPAEDLSGLPEDVCYRMYKRDYQLAGYEKAAY